MAAPLTKAELIRQRKALADIAERRRQIEEEERAAGAALALDSTLDASLRAQLVLEHDASADTLEKIAALFDDETTLADITPDEEDVMDAEFWETGIEEPDFAKMEATVDAAAGLSSTQSKLLKKLIRGASASWCSLNVKFTKRAIYAYELKRIYANKREQVSPRNILCSVFIRCPLLTFFPVVVVVYCVLCVVLPFH